MRFRWIAAATVIAIAATSTSAHTSPQTASVGTAVISGVLVSDTATPQPVRRATVRLSTGSKESARLIGTDDDGRFVFGELPAASFTLSASKPGFVETFYGSKHPGRGPGVRVALAPGQHIEISLKILPGAVIAGVVSDPRGHPISGVAAQAVEIRGQGVSPIPPARGVTDDRGMYRLFGLAPGDYIGSANPRLVPYGRGANANFGEVLNITDAEVQAARASASGASTAGPTQAPSSGALIGYAPIYFPGTADAGAAGKISVAAGEERSNVSMSVRIMPMARIAGTFTDPNGQPVTSATVRLLPRHRDSSSLAEQLVASGALTLPASTRSATGFLIAGVPPGEYTLLARSGTGGRGAAPPTDVPLGYYNLTDLTVDGRDQTDLVLRLVPGLKISGTIAFDHSTLTPPVDLSRIALTLSPSVAGSILSSARAVVGSKGDFAFSGLIPGVYSLVVQPPEVPGGAHWTLKSAVLDGRDLADGAFEIKPDGDISGLVVTFSDRAGEISGRLVDPAGRPIARYSIVVFPADRALWLAGSRRVQLAPPATDGAFRITGLPAGDYAIAAAEDVDTSDLADTAFLGRLLSGAYKITLGEGEKKTQDLRVGG